MKRSWTSGTPVKPRLAVLPDTRFTRTITTDYPAIIESDGRATQSPWREQPVGYACGWVLALGGHMTTEARRTMTSTPDSYQRFTLGDADEMVQLLSTVFALGDPPAVAVGLTVPEFAHLVGLYTHKADAEGLTIVARSAVTGEMIGALLAEDSASAPPDGLERLSAKFGPIFDILGQLDIDATAGPPRSPGTSLHLFLLGVAPWWAGRGIAQRLVRECLANGRRKGYRVAVTEATNRTSQHVFRKLGFVERARRSYGAHRFEGRACFGAIADQGGPMRMDRGVTP
jgi:ribosomal protein S18 acetylase RimI-like enzyme